MEGLTILKRFALEEPKTVQRKDYAGIAKAVRDAAAIIRGDVLPVEGTVALELVVNRLVELFASDATFDELRFRRECDV